MRIRLLADYRGILSGELFFLAGEYETPAGMSEDVARALVDAGRAELLEDDPTPAPKPRTTRTKRQR